MRSLLNMLFFFFNDTATTEIYTLSLHDALPICRACVADARTTDLGHGPRLASRTRQERRASLRRRGVVAPAHFPFGPRGSMLSCGSSVLGRQRSDSPGADPGSSLSSTAMHSIRVGPALRML